jgi:uncharacterized protein YukJ
MMSNLTYSVLKGRIQNAKPFSANRRKRPHFHILVEGGGAQFDVAVNIVSEDPHVDDVRVLFAVKENIQPPRVAELLSLTDGIVDVTDGSDLGLDYVADSLVTRDEMSLLPIFDPRAGEIEPNEIMNLVNQAVHKQQVRIYAFGHRYTDNPPTDPAWHFSPDDGVHNIHMNQGNAPGNHDDENGRHEDGALLIHFEDTDTWTGVYVAFQTQSFDNGADGFPL